MVDDEVEREALARRLCDAGWVYVSWDTHNRAWQFQGRNGARRLLAAETLADAMRLLLLWLADRDARDL